MCVCVCVVVAYTNLIEKNRKRKIASPHKRAAHGNTGVQTGKGPCMQLDNSPVYTCDGADVLTSLALAFQWVWWLFLNVATSFNFFFFKPKILIL